MTVLTGSTKQAVEGEATSSTPASSSHDDEIHVEKPTAVTKVVSVISSDTTQPVSASKKAKKQFAHCYIGDAADLGHLSQLGFDPVTGKFNVSDLCSRINDFPKLEEARDMREIIS